MASPITGRGTDGRVPSKVSDKSCAGRELVIGDQNDHVERVLGVSTGPTSVCMTPNQYYELFNTRPIDGALGCGTFGCAWPDPIDPQSVVKMTYDGTDVDGLLLAKQHDLPDVVRVKQAWKLRQPGRRVIGVAYDKKRQPAALRYGAGAPVWAMRVERVRGLTADEKKIFNGLTIRQGLANWLIALTRAWKGPTTKFELPKDAGASIEYMCRLQAADDDWTPSEAKQCHQVGANVATMFRRLVRNGILWSDMHGGNVGVDAKGRLKVVDLGLAATALKPEAPPVLDGAKRKRKPARKPARKKR